jgi:hypothetical protein
MERTYRLEFNEKKQKFHLDNYTHVENTHEWVTIIEHCTDLEFRVFESYANRIGKDKLTVEYLLQCKVELHRFWVNLLDYNVIIKQGPE